MNQNNQIELECSSILQVPLDKFGHDFTFIVNGKEFRTNRIISNLLSPKISQQYSIDPTINTFIINTKTHGDFSKILQLINFKRNDFSDEELPFAIEVLDILNNNKIQIKEHNRIELTKENIINQLLQHENSNVYFTTRYEEEIKFICQNMSEIMKTQEEELTKLSLPTLERIISNEQLSIENEDVLLQFVNKLYLKDSKYSVLYEHAW